VLVSIGSGVRWLYIDLHVIFAWLGALNAFVCLSAWWLLYQRKLAGYEAEAVVAIVLICMIPLVSLTGGVNSQFVYPIPITPLVVAMLGGARIAGIAGAIWALLIVMGLQFHGALIDLTGDSTPDAMAYARGVWLLAATLAATTFAVYFSQARERLTEQLASLATTDHLTGLLNRRATEGAIDAEIDRLRRHGGSLSVLLADVDDFKLFNDSYGHASGDDALVRVAQALRRNQRAIDSVGRWGGEEFLIVLPLTGPAAAASVAEKLRALIAAVPLMPGTQPLTVTIGICTTTGPSPDDRVTLLRDADKALYAGKASGRNTVVIAGAVPAGKES